MIDVYNKSEMRADYDKSKVEKRAIVDKKELMNEMYLCKECDCESYPYCSVFGSLCRECFDL